MKKIVTVTLPDIGEGVVEGEVIEWLKKINDPVMQDEPVVVVMTDKATVELPSPSAGILIKQHYQPGQIAIKDKPLYEIEVNAEAENEMTSNLAKENEQPTPSQEKTKKEPLQQPKTANKLGTHAQAAPPTRLLARQLELDINQIPGSGADGRVLHEDLVQYSKKNEKSSNGSAPITHFEDDQEVPLIGIRNLMAKKMALSNELIPHFSYFEQIEATRLVQLRYRFKAEAAKEGIAVTYMPFVLKALSMALLQYPIANSSLDVDNNKVILHKQHNIGIATSTKQGLIVPVLKNVDQMTLEELILAYEQLKQRALSGKLHAEDMKGATITVTNFGVLGGGGMWATPIINYPETAILGLSRIQKQPVVRNDAVVIRDVLNLSWSFDHRVIDGDQAATISHYLSNLLQNPAALL